MISLRDSKTQPGRMASCLPVMALAALCYLAGTENAYASMETVLCDIYDLVVGTYGPPVASAAVIAIGIGAVTGRVSAGLALTVSAGIMITWGVTGIVTHLGIPMVCP